MNFLEFNVPKVLEKNIDRRVNRKSVLEHTYKRGKLKIVWTFTPAVMQRIVQNDMKKEYEKHLKRENNFYKSIKKVVLKAKKKLWKKSL